MDTLARWAGYVGVAGGGVGVIRVVLVTSDPNSGAWFAFFLVVALLGAAVLGFENRTRAATEQLGRASEWLSAIGAAALLAVFVYASATGRLTSDASATSDPLAPFWMVTAVAWVLGNIGFPVAIIPGRVLSVMGGWLRLCGGGTRPGVPAGLGGEPPP